MALGIASLMHVFGMFRSDPDTPPVSSSDLCPPERAGFLTAEMLRYPCSTNGVRWKLLSSVSAHRAMVIRIEMRDPLQAAPVAQRLVDREGDRFDEVLVYVLRSDDPQPVLTRRIQWTPRGGYVTSEYSAP
jgi:hypothetical protein